MRSPRHRALAASTNCSPIAAARWRWSGVPTAARSSACSASRQRSCCATTARACSLAADFAPSPDAAAQRDLRRRHAGRVSSDGAVAPSAMRASRTPRRCAHRAPGSAASTGPPAPAAERPAAEDAFTAVQRRGAALERPAWRVAQPRPHRQRRTMIVAVVAGSSATRDRGSRRSEGMLFRRRARSACSNQGTALSDRATPSSRLDRARCIRAAAAARCRHASARLAT